MKIFNILILTFMWSINSSWATNPNDAGAPEKQPIKPTPLEGGINNPLPPNSTAKCDTRQYQAASAISLKTIAGCLKSKHFLGR